MIFVFHLYKEARTALITKLANCIKTPTTYKAALNKLFLNSNLQVTNIQNLITSYIDDSAMQQQADIAKDAFIRYATKICDDIFTAIAIISASIYLRHSLELSSAQHNITTPSPFDHEDFGKTMSSTLRITMVPGATIILAGAARDNAIVGVNRVAGGSKISGIPLLLSSLVMLSTTVILVANEIKFSFDVIEWATPLKGGAAIIMVGDITTLSIDIITEVSRLNEMHQAILPAMILNFPVYYYVPMLYDSITAFAALMLTCAALYLLPIGIIVICKVPHAGAILLLLGSLVIGSLSIMSTSLEVAKNAKEAIQSDCHEHLECFTSLNIDAILHIAPSMITITSIANYVVLANHEGNSIALGSVAIIGSAVVVLLDVTLDAGRVVRTLFKLENKTLNSIQLEEPTDSVSISFKEQDKIWDYSFWLSKLIYSVNEASSEIEELKENLGQCDVDFVIDLMGHHSTTGIIEATDE